MTINYIFTDWQQSQTKSNNKSYPPFRAASRQYPLWSLEETEDWISRRLQQIKKLTPLAQDQLPKCTPEELWAETIYKYYKNPNKTTRSTGNFKTMDEKSIINDAIRALNSLGYSGISVTRAIESIMLKQADINFLCGTNFTITLEDPFRTYGSI